MRSAFLGTPEASLAEEYTKSAVLSQVPSFSSPNHLQSIPHITLYCCVFCMRRCQVGLQKYWVSSHFCRDHESRTGGNSFLDASSAWSQGWILLIRKTIVGTDRSQQLQAHSLDRVT